MVQKDQGRKPVLPFHPAEQISPLGLGFQDGRHESFFFQKALKVTGSGHLFSGRVGRVHLDIVAQNLGSLFFDSFPINAQKSPVFHRNFTAEHAETAEK